tara:strand:- start:537 stop:1130 length:594 start_codon:yes stop_codon:yes gene_type:complete
MADPSYISGGVLTDGEAWVGIATTTLGSATSSVTFTSPNDGSSLDWCQFMDLVVIAYVATDHSASDLLKCHLNGDTTNANYPYQYLWGDAGSGEIEGSNATTSSRGIESRFCSAATNIFTAIVYNFLDMNSGKYKTTLVRTSSNLDAAIQSSISCITTSAWLSNAAINSIAFTPNAGSNIAAGSMFSLFGVLPRMVS